MFFNDIHVHLSILRAEQNLDDCGHLDLIFADDVTTATSHTRKECLEEEAWKESDDFGEALKVKGLGNTREKSSNFLTTPGETEKSFFRREPNAHRAAGMEK